MGTVPGRLASRGEKEHLGVSSPQDSTGSASSGDNRSQGSQKGRPCALESVCRTYLQSDIIDACLHILK